MLRLLHTADVQLGMKANDAGVRGERLRAARLETLRRLVDLAQEREVHCVLIAGDLFENNQVKPVTVAQAVQILQALDPVPVFILPGNHDWLDGSSVYERHDFREGPSRNVHVLRAPEPLPFRDDVMLYPCPLGQRTSPLDPTDWIPPREREDVIRIGIAHGCLPHARPEDRDFPIGVDTAVLKGLDYLALGHYHNRQVFSQQRVAMAGTPEQTKFGEQDTGYVLIVELDGPGTTPRIEPVPVGTLTWLDLTAEWGEGAGAARQALQQRIAELPAGDSTLLRLKLTGVVRPDELVEVEHLRTWLTAHCENRQLLHGELSEKLRTTEAVAGALRELVQGDTVLAGALADLDRLAALETGGEKTVETVVSRPVDELVQTVARASITEYSPSQVAGEAVLLLARLAEEVV